MFNQKISRMFEKHFFKKIDHASSEHADNNSAADTHTWQIPTFCWSIIHRSSHTEQELPPPYSEWFPLSVLLESPICDVL